MNELGFDEISLQRLEEEIDGNLLKVEELSETKPEEAFSLLMSATVMMNMWIQRAVTNIIGKLSGWIGKIKNLLKSLARKMNAKTFSISIGGGIITLTVSWEV